MSNDFFNSDKMFQTMGTFWYSLYESSDEIQSLLDALIVLQKQIDCDTKAAQDSLSRKDIHVFRSKQWYRIMVSEENLLKWSKQCLRYGEPEVTYGNGQYGNCVEKRWRIKVPEYLVAVEAVATKPDTGSLTWENVSLEGSYLYLPGNPFDSGFVSNPVYNDSGLTTGREVELWLYNVQVDYQDIYKQFGYAIGLRLPSSESYKQLVNVLMDSLINGPSYATFMRCASILTGIPVVRNPVETVLRIEGNTVTTDKTVYNFSENDTVTVKVGDTLQLGDTLSEGLQLLDCDCGLKVLPALALSDKFISKSGRTSAILPNVELPLTIAYNEEETVVTLPILGL